MRRIFGDISVGPGAAALVGSGNAEFNVGTGVTVNAHNLLSSISGTTALNNAGTISGAFQSASGNVAVRNALDAVLNLTPSSASFFGGANDQFVNSGVTNASGTTTLGGLELFTDTATGSLDIGNGAGGDHLILGGGMANLAGSQIFMDIDLSMPFAPTRNDVITVMGNLSSSGGAFVLNNIGPAGAVVDFNDLVLINAVSIDPNAQFSVTGL